MNIIYPSSDVPYLSAFPPLLLITEFAEIRSYMIKHMKNFFQKEAGLFKKEKL